MVYDKIKNDINEYLNNFKYNEYKLKYHLYSQEYNKRTHLILYSEYLSYIIYYQNGNYIISKIKNIIGKYLYDYNFYDNNTILFALNNHNDIRKKRINKLINNEKINSKK